jgi:hypothetical protein
MMAFRYLSASKPLLLSEKSYHLVSDAAPCNKALRFICRVVTRGSPMSQNSVCLVIYFTLTLFLTLSTMDLGCLELQMFLYVSHWWIAVLCNGCHHLFGCKYLIFWPQWAVQYLDLDLWPHAFVDIAWVQSSLKLANILQMSSCKRWWNWWMAVLHDCCNHLFSCKYVPSSYLSEQFSI